MIDNSFRSQLPRYTSWLIRLYKFLKLTPNQITIAGFIFSCVSAALVANSIFIPAGFVWWLGRLLDGTDGIYARETNQTSQFGSFLDITCDMASYSLMIIGFFLAYPQLGLFWLLVLLLYVLCITSALALGNLQEKLGVGSEDNRGLRLASGLAEGGETGLAYTAFILFPSQIEYLLYAWLGILLLTIVARSLLAKQELVA